MVKHVETEKKFRNINSKNNIKYHMDRKIPLDYIENFLFIV